MQNGVRQDEKHRLQGEILNIDPTRFLTDAPQKQPAKNDVALIILNSPIASFKHFQNLYDHAGFVVCADGGADRLYDLLTLHFSDLAYDVALAKYLPNAIHGDLDSISDKAKHAFQALGVKVTRDGDQYSTDFQKAVKLIQNEMPRVRDIVVLGSLGGRIDQGIGLLHELYREQCLRHTKIKFWLVSEVSISVVLEVGTTRLTTKLAAGIITRNIGILPVYGPAVISTHGLEWDVQEWKSEMGGNVSSSNHIMKDAIDITTDRPVLFTVELVA